MMLIAASCPSKSEAAVTKRILFLACIRCAGRHQIGHGCPNASGPEDGRLLYRLRKR